MASPFKDSIRLQHASARFRILERPEMVLENGSTCPCHVIGVDDLRSVAENILKLVEHYESKGRL